MNATRKTAVMVGVCFILATVCSLISTALIGPVKDAPTYLTTVSAHGNQMILGALFEVAAAIAVVLIPALLFPILKQYHEGLALGYFGVRILEAITQIICAMSALLLLTVSQSYVNAGPSAASSFQASGTVLLATWNWAFPLDPIVFGPGSLLLNAVLYQTRLIPRWLSAWGVLGAALVFVSGVFGMFGNPLLVLAIPIAVQEMVLAVWLIVKGFTPSARAAESATGFHASANTAEAI
jgi:hypothetical protein